MSDVSPDSTPEAGTTKQHISKEEINRLPLLAWEGPVEVIDSRKNAAKSAAMLAQEPILGFDTETRPSFRKGESHPPALVQLASARCVYLFRISKLGTLAPLLPLFEDPGILKTGVAIRDDVKELRAMEDFEPAGFTEIADITQKLGYENRGLRPLAALLLGGRISKAAQVSNWARQTLDAKQIRYAATDAWISRELYLKTLS